MKRLSNTEAELKKKALLKKKRVLEANAQTYVLRYHIYIKVLCTTLKLSLY